MFALNLLYFYFYRYWAKLTGIVPLNPSSVETMAAGLILKDGTVCRPATLQLHEDGCAGPAGVLLPRTPDPAGEDSHPDDHPDQVALARHHHPPHSLQPCISLVRSLSLSSSLFALLN
jgi:hypothetical protein